MSAQELLEENRKTLASKPRVIWFRKALKYHPKSLWGVVKSLRIVKILDSLALLVSLFFGKRTIV